MGGGCGEEAKGKLRAQPRAALRRELRPEREDGVQRAAVEAVREGARQAA